MGRNRGREMGSNREGDVKKEWAWLDEGRKRREVTRRN